MDSSHTLEITPAAAGRYSDSSCGMSTGGMIPLAFRANDQILPPCTWSATLNSQRYCDAECVDGSGGAYRRQKTRYSTGKPHRAALSLSM